MSEEIEFPKLKESASTLNLQDPIARGHLIDGRLGTIPVSITHQWMTVADALVAVDEFNRITGLKVVYDTVNNKLIYPE